MLFGNKNISKAISALLLVALLLIHSVKLLHSHPNHSFGNDIQTGQVVKNNSDCNVCSYQLTKDTDGQGRPGYEVNIPSKGFVNLYFNSSYEAPFYPAYEGRGPPSGI